MGRCGLYTSVCKPTTTVDPHTSQSGIIDTLIIQQTYGLIPRLEVKSGNETAYMLEAHRICDGALQLRGTIKQKVDARDTM